MWTLGGDKPVIPGIITLRADWGDRVIGASALKRGEIRTGGGTRPVAADAWIIAATHRDLEAAVQNGTFRMDLFHRLNVFPVCLPPLRERPGDIPALV